VKYQVYTAGSHQFLDEGEGDVLILMHGLFGHPADFEQTVAYFSTRYRLIVPLLPLYSLPQERSNLEGMLQYLEQLTELIALKDFTLVGNSLGGHVALLYTLRHPKKVTSLVLTGSSGLFEKAFGASLPRRSDYDYVQTKTRQTFFNPDMAGKALVDEVFDIVNNREQAWRVLSMVKSAVRNNLAADLCHLQRPVLLIWGKNDNITPADVAEEFHKLIPHSELRWIDACGHIPMMEQPEAFNKLLEGFLRSLKQTV
jgi:2-hydroxy-6-oxonona-2,4-dienedioate hydrolase